MVDASRGVLILVAGALLLSWLATAGTERPDPPPIPTSQPASGDPLLRDLQAQTERLRSRVVSAPRPSPIARNPFRFGEAPPPAAPVAIGHADPPAAGPPAASPIALIGLAQDDGSTAARRIAILSVPGDLLLVTAGDTILDRYRVESVGPDTIELRALDGTASLVLRLP